MNFINLIRQPDDVKVKTEKSPFRFEEPNTLNPTDCRVDFVEENGSMKVIANPSKDAVEGIRIRFSGEFYGANKKEHISILGDCLERSYWTDLIWKSFSPHDLMPWFFYMYNGEVLHSYGVKTGCNTFAYWQCDPYGITLWLDLRNGADGIVLDEPLLCAEIVCREGNDGEIPFDAARDFCKMMCPKPNLPQMPVYGFNNWYWAYGDIDEKTVLKEAEYVSSLTSSLEVRPFMVIDDGWQLPHTVGFNGGPWDLSNERFSHMAEVSGKINQAGCQSGIWFRPLLTMGHIPDGAEYKTQKGRPGSGLYLDASHPYTLEKVAKDVRMLNNWGYKLIKHDFSSYDILTMSLNGAGHFYDRTKTTAQIIKNLYKTIQDNANDSLVIGCNTMSHLAAGIHQIQRVGSDTNGHNFEFTRRYGVHSMMRFPLNNAFYSVDCDCAACTDEVSIDLNLDFLKATAMCGGATFASVKPNILKPNEEKKLSEILSIAANVKEENHAKILDWHTTSNPSVFEYCGEEYRFNWYREHFGARTNADGER